MIFNIQENLQNYINQAIDKRLAQLPISYPCKVKSVDSGFVEVETLLIADQNDIAVKIPIMQSPYLTLPIQEGDIGIALNCSYLFDSIINDVEVKENIKSIQKNGLFFIPLLPASKANKSTDITLTSANGDSQIVLNDSELSIKVANQEALSSDGSAITTPLPIQQQNTPIDISGSGGSLGDYSGYILQLLDALASGMSGSATNATAYNTLKSTLQPQIEAIFK